MKRLISLLLCIAMLFGVLAVASFAEGEEWVFQGEYEVEPISDIIPYEEPSPSPETEITENTEVPEETQTETEIPTETEEENKPTQEEQTVEQNDQVTPGEESLEYENAVLPRTLTNGVVTVTGNIPEGINLQVFDAQMMGTFSLRDEEPVEEENPVLCQLDISLVDDYYNEWQPGEPVTVTLDSYSLGLADNTWYEITHVHVDPVTYEETVTTFPAYAENGAMTFTLNGFSVIIIRSIFSDVTINTNDAVFYYAYSNQTYGSWDVLGFYIANGEVHALLGSEKSDSSSINPSSAVISGTNYNVVSTVKDNITFKSIKITSGGTTIVNVKGYARYWWDFFHLVDFQAYADINLGALTIDYNNPQYTISGTYNNTPFNLTGRIELPKIEKKVASGQTTSSSSFNSTNITIDNFDNTKDNWVTFQINVKNEYDARITLQSIVDTMSTSDFDTIKVYNSSTKKWVDPNTSGLGINVNGAYTPSPIVYLPEGTNTYYISARINPNINLSGGQKDLINTVSVTPQGVTSKSTTATVTVKSKAQLVITASGLDAGQNSVYHVTGSGVDLTVTMENSNSVTITNLPAGSYTVTPVGDWTSRYTTSAQNVTVAAGGTANAPFTFTKKSTTAKWLYGFDSEENNFAGVP